MNDTTMTIVGNLVENPTLRTTKSGHSVANFRVASTPRRFDREKNTWVDCDTLFVTVTAWRSLGENVARSLFKGQPVIVTGRYYQREFEQNETLRTTYALEATAIGHDLSRGVARFERTMRSVLAPSVAVDDDGIPVDDSEHFLDLADESIEVDPVTGEVRELAASG